MRRLHAPRTARRHAPLFIALAVALWFASTLGLMHRVLHIETFPSAASLATSGQAQASDRAAAPLGGRSLLSLFGEHVDADCRLYDQLAGGAAALSVPLVVLPIALPMARFHYFLGEALARWVTLFDARGPPLTR